MLEDVPGTLNSLKSQGLALNPKPLNPKALNRMPKRRLAGNGSVRSLRLLPVGTILETQTCL